MMYFVSVYLFIVCSSFFFVFFFPVLEFFLWGGGREVTKFFFLAVGSVTCRCWLYVQITITYSLFDGYVMCIHDKATPTYPNSHLKRHYYSALHLFHH